MHVLKKMTSKWKMNCMWVNDFINEKLENYLLIINCEIFLTELI